VPRYKAPSWTWIMLGKGSAVLFSCVSTALTRPLALKWPHREVGCLGHDFDESLLKSLISVATDSSEELLLSTGPIEAKATFLESARILERLGTKLFATKERLIS